MMSYAIISPGIHRTNRRPWLLALLFSLLVLSWPFASARAENGQVTMGIIGGLAAGALLGTVISKQGQKNRHHHHPPPLVYDDYYAYEPPPIRCWKQPVRQPLYDAWGRFVGHRTVHRRVCSEE